MDLNIEFILSKYLLYMILYIFYTTTYFKYPKMTFIVDGKHVKAAEP